jgi:membrane-bound metal-dependent hydrolase YbcI (DUF457 family)
MWKYIFTGLPVALGVGILIAGVGTLSFTALLILCLILGFTAFLAYRRSPVHQQNFEQPDYRQWYWFYFWVIATHIVLDIFTTYGTQALWPFTDYPFALGQHQYSRSGLYDTTFVLFIDCEFFFAQRFKEKNFQSAGPGSQFIVYHFYVI